MILITGAGGYIGRHLARALQVQGAAVRGLDRHAAALAPLGADGVETVVADVADPAALGPALDGVRVVYHLAGSALGGRQEIRRANVTSTEALARLCAGRAAIETFVYASSGALYPSGNTWLSEELAPAPAFGYARAKHEAEQILLQAYTAVQLPVMIARIAAVYGPGSPALMVESVRRGRFPLIGGGHGYASNIHIDDVIAALLALLRQGRPGRIYNLADDEPAPVNEFYNYLAHLLGAPPPPTLPPGVGHALVLLVNTLSRLRGRAGPLPPDLVAMAAVSHRMANRRMREELQVTPRYPSFREGLPATLGL